MSGPLAHARAELADAESARAAAQAGAQTRWRDVAYRSFHGRYLQPLRTEVTRFDAALATLDAALGRALSLID